MLMDLAIVIAGFVVAVLAVGLLGLPVFGQLAVITAVALAWWRLVARGESWRSVGLRKPNGWRRAVLAVVLLYFLVVALVLAIVNPLGEALDWPPLNLSAFEDLRGDAVRLAATLLLVWTTVAFGEELLFRGFLLSRIERLIGAGTAATAGAVVAQAALFGAGHASLGIRGVATAAVVALVYGAWYAFRDRNLWPLIIAHGITDTITLTAVYAGAVPQ
jgi:membrane protease YdiL (CAAX protease family)